MCFEINDCEEQEIPQVDNTSLGCCGATPSKCVLLSKANIYFNLEKGDNLDDVIDAIERKLKTIEGV